MATLCVSVSILFTGWIFLKCTVISQCKRPFKPVSCIGWCLHLNYCQIDAAPILAVALLLVSEACLWFELSLNAISKVENIFIIFYSKSTHKMRNQSNANPIHEYKVRSHNRRIFIHSSVGCLPLVSVFNDKNYQFLHHSDSAARIKSRFSEIYENLRICPWLSLISAICRHVTGGQANNPTSTNRTILFHTMLNHMHLTLLRWPTLADTWLYHTLVCFTILN